MSSALADYFKQKLFLRSPFFRNLVVGTSEVLEVINFISELAGTDNFRLFIEHSCWITKSFKHSELLI